MKAPLPLQELHTELSRYHTASCGLIHEQVAVSASEIEALPRDAEGSGLRRLGFCPASLRRWRLGCAHTMAGAHFNQLVLEAEVQGLATAAARQAINQLLTRIYLLDHRKGEADKKRALAQRAHVSAVERAAAEKELANLVAEHGLLVKELEQWRQELLRKMEAALKERA